MSLIQFRSCCRDLFIDLAVYFDVFCCWVLWPWTWYWSLQSYNFSAFPPPPSSAPTRCSQICLFLVFKEWNLTNTWIVWMEGHVCWIRQDQKRCGLGILQGIILQSPREAEENYGKLKHNQCPGQHSNLAPLKSKTEILLLQMTCSVNCVNYTDMKRN